MDIKDKLIESLCNLIKKEEQTQKLCEFSVSKQYIINKLWDIRLKVNEHLICCYIWNNTDNYNHWKTEVGGFFEKLPRVKGTNKFPTEKQLHKWIIDDTIEEIEDSINYLVRRTEQDEKVSISKYDSKVLQNYLIDFWNWLANYLADGNEVMPNDIYSEIDELVNKYK